MEDRLTTVYREQPPTAALACSVECCWSLTTTSGETGHRVPPDGCLDILYQRGYGLRAVGAMTAARQFDLAAGTCFAGIRFHPGTAAVYFGIPASRLTDTTLALDDLWHGRARELARQLDDAESVGDLMRRLLLYVETHARNLNPVQRAIAAMTQVNGTLDLDWIARQCDLSPRQFRRRCLEESGLTPKRLSRILRFRRAYNCAVSAGNPDWPAIAVQGGYYDQAHLIREFKEFIGVSPMSVLSNTSA